MSSPDRAAGVMVGGAAVLAIDTGTSSIVVGLARPDGTPLGSSAWVAGHRHGETLLPAIEEVLRGANVTRQQLAGIIVGTGPGTFTGLRVGLATAKGLAHGLGIPIVGVSTAAALLESAADDDPAAAPDLALLLPAGPQDRVLVHRGVATHLPAATGIDLPATTTLVAVDLEGRAPADATARGDRAVRGLAAALITLGTRRLGAGEHDSLDLLVPEYVTLPRGVVRQTGEVTWSRDPR